jgi:hypothetical protein
MMRAMCGTTARERTAGMDNQIPKFNFGKAPKGANYTSFIARRKKPQVL